MELKYWSLRQIIEDNSEPQAPIIDNGVLLKNTILTVFGAPKARKSFPLSYSTKSSISVVSSGA